MNQSEFHTKILLIEDDESIGAMLVEYLQKNGCHVRWETSLARGRIALQSSLADLLLLDLMLPDGDGLDFCRDLRNDSACKALPVIILTARGDELDRVLGLEIGADDYMGKPFSPRELLARIKAVLRRVGSASAPSEVLRAGDLVLDVPGRQVTLQGREIALTTQLFDLLHLLVRRAGRVQSRDALMEELHGNNWEVYDRSIDLAVSRLRAALGDDPKHPKIIKSVRGVGYVLAVRNGAAD